MTLYDIPLHTLTGEPTTLGAYRGQAVLLVNVASKCGLTPQYAGLERLQKTVRGPRLHRARCAVQPVRGPGAGERGGDPDVLLDDVRGQLPAAGEGRRQR